MHEIGLGCKKRVDKIIPSIFADEKQNLSNHKTDAMKQNPEKQEHLIELAYISYRERVLRFIQCRINDGDEAEDLTQDVFVRLIDCKQMLSEVTLQNFVFTIARNLVNDYLRRHYKWQEISAYLIEVTSALCSETENRIVARDLASHEQFRLLHMPKQRATIYRLSRFEEQDAGTIAESLNLSKRTVENHLRLGRQEMRSYMRQCI